MRRPPTPWTPDEDRQLVELYGEGLTFAAIAAILGRPLGSVASRAGDLRDRGEDLEPRMPRWTQEQRDRLARRYREGATRNQLITEFGKARGTIGRQLAALRAAGVDLTRSGSAQHHG